MKTRGVIRLTTPDFDKVCDAYERKDEEFFTYTVSRNGVSQYNYPWDGFSFEQSLIHYFAGSLTHHYSDDEINKLYNERGRYRFAEKF